MPAQKNKLPRQGVAAKCFLIDAASLAIFKLGV
jgi:hypothetical protein